MLGEEVWRRNDGSFYFQNLWNVACVIFVLLLRHWAGCRFLFSQQEQVSILEGRPWVLLEDLQTVTLQGPGDLKRTSTEQTERTRKVR